MSRASIYVNVDFVKVHVINNSSWVTVPSYSYADLNSTVAIPIEYLYGADSSCISANAGCSIVGNKLMVPVVTSDVTVTLSNAKAMVTVSNQDEEAIQSVTPSHRAAAPGETVTFTVTYNSGYNSSSSKSNATNASLSGNQLSVSVASVDDVVTVLVPNTHMVSVTNNVPYIDVVDYQPQFVRHGSTEVRWSVRYNDSSTNSCARVTNAMLTQGMGEYAVQGQLVTTTTINADTTVTMDPVKVQVKITNQAPYHVESISPEISYVAPGTSVQAQITYAAGYIGDVLYSSIGTISQNTLTIPTNSSSYSLAVSIFRGADSVIELGTSGTYEAYYTPFYPYYNYTVSQQIYRADELGDNCLIKAVAFNYISSDEYESMSRHVKLYMTPTTESKKSTTGRFTSVDAADCVFDGTINISSNQWVNVTFDKPFSYDNSKNVLLTIEDITGNWVNASGYWRSYNGTGYCLISYNDNAAYDIAHLSGETPESYETRTSTKLTVITFIEDTPD